MTRSRFLIGSLCLLALAAVALVRYYPRAHATQIIDSSGSVFQVVNLNDSTDVGGSHTFVLDKNDSNKNTNVLFSSSDRPLVITDFQCSLPFVSSPGVVATVSWDIVPTVGFPRTVLFQTVSGTKPSEASHLTTGIVLRDGDVLRAVVTTSGTQSTDVSVTASGFEF